MKWRGPPPGRAVPLRPAAVVLLVSCTRCESRSTAGNGAR
jgi:hypothetical protein